MQTGPDLEMIDHEIAPLSAELRRAAAGDDDAVAELHRLFFAPLARFMARGAVEDPEGLANTAFERTVRKLPDFADYSERAFRAYLYRTARNLIIDESRRVAVRPQKADGDLISIYDLPDPRGRFEHCIAERDFVDGLLDGLTESQRQVIEYRFFDDLTLEDTAARTGQSLTAVKGMQRRALVAMKTALLAGVAVLLVLIIGGRITLEPDVVELPVISDGTGGRGGTDDLEQQPETPGGDEGSLDVPDGSVSSESQTFPDGSVSVEGAQDRELPTITWGVGMAGDPSVGDSEVGDNGAAGVTADDTEVTTDDAVVLDGEEDDAIVLAVVTPEAEDDASSPWWNPDQNEGLSGSSPVGVAAADRSLVSLSARIGAVPEAPTASSPDADQGADAGDAPTTDDAPLERAASDPVPAATSEAENQNASASTREVQASRETAARFVQTPQDEVAARVVAVPAAPPVVATAAPTTEATAEPTVEPTTARSSSATAPSTSATASC